MANSGNFATTNSATGSFPRPAQQPIPPPVDRDSNKLILRGRIRSPKSALALHQYLWQADWENMRHRALVQRLLDGWPPHGRGSDARMGQGGRTNVNFGHVRRAFQKEVAPYNAVLESMDPICYIPTNYGTAEQRLWMEPIISEEWSRAMTNWPRFNALWQQTTRLYISEGVGMEMWQDEWDWRWMVMGMQQMKFPRRVQPCVENMDVWTVKIDMLCSDLFRYIMYPDSARKLGWNPEAVEASIMKAVPVGWIPSDFQEFQRIMKDLDLLPQATAPMIETLHTFAKELDGTISHYISRYDADGKWLYKKLGKFKSAKHFMVMYTYDVGTNGDLHSIRGQPSNLFNAGVMIDRTLSAAADAVIQASTAVLKTNGITSEDAYLSLPYRAVGPGLMSLNEGFEFAPQNTPKFQESLGPWYDTVRGIFGEQVSDTIGVPDGNGTGPYVSDKRTESQVMAGNQMTEGGMALFFPPKRELFKEVIRRMSRRTYAQNEPGGREVWDLRNRLLKRGVPLDAWYQVDIDGVEINTGFGRGSTQARRIMADSIMAKYPYYDAQGQNIALRTWTAAYSNSRMAKMLVPLVANARPPQDLEDANNENTPLMSGPIFAANIQVLGNQNHVVHCQSHAEALTRLFQYNSAGQLPPDQAVQMMQPLHAHALQHLQLINPPGPPTRRRSRPRWSR